MTTLSWIRCLVVIGLLGLWVADCAAQDTPQDQLQITPADGVDTADDNNEHTLELDMDESHNQEEDLEPEAGQDSTFDMEQGDGDIPQTAAMEDDPSAPTIPAPDPGPAAPMRPQEPMGEAPVVSNTLPEVALAENDIRLNFRGVSLDVVLDYLSRATGYAVIKEADITGTVDVVSHHPLSPAEAVELLNTVLGTKNLAAVRTDRILRIVTRDQAKIYDLPVIQGGDPEEIPKTEDMVTQIIPVRYADATKLLDNLQPMLADYTGLSANQSSNAIVITDTQTNIRRIASIIKALDTSISMITEVRVFPLKYADAEDLAKVVTGVFEEQSSAAAGGANRGRNRMEMFMRMRGGGPPGGGDDAGGPSEAKQAANRIKVVGDAHSNCLVVGAPTEMLDTIADLVREVDIPGEDTAVMQVFPLKFADADSVAETLTNLMGTGSTANQQRNTRFGPFGMGRFGNFGGGNQDQGRALKSVEFKAVADKRTNSVIVSASRQTIDMLEAVIEDLDATPKNVPQVYVHKIEHADLEALQEILEGMFDDIDTTTSRSPGNTTRANVTGARSTRGTPNAPNPGRSR